MSSERFSSWRERLASPLTWHAAGFAVLLVLVIGFAIRLGLDWAATNGRSTDVLAGKQVELKALELQPPLSAAWTSALKNPAPRWRPSTPSASRPTTPQSRSALAIFRSSRECGSQECNTRKALPVRK